MTEPRTFRVSETSGYCAPPRARLDLYVDDTTDDGDMAIWDGRAWMFKSLDGGRFDKLWEERAMLELDKAGAFHYVAVDETHAFTDSFEVNAKGAKQSRLDTRWDLLPSNALLAAAQITKYGADTYGVGNWRKIPVEDHLNHALEHIFSHLESVRLGLIEDADEDGTTAVGYDLAHAMVRLMYAMEIDMAGEDD